MKKKKNTKQPNKKNILIIGIIVIALGIMIFGNKEEKKEEQQDVSKKDVFEYIKIIEPENTVEEINKIIGFNGKKTSEDKKIYKWQFVNGTSLRVQYSADNLGQIEISFPTSMIEDEEIDFSNVKDIKEAVDKGEDITYDEIVKKLGNKQGTLKFKTKRVEKYEWKKGDGKYCNCSFNAENKKCINIAAKY